MKHNQSGFSVVEALLIFIVVGLITGTGWYVWGAKKKAELAQSKTNQGATVTPQKTPNAGYKKPEKQPAPTIEEKNGRQYVALGGKTVSFIAPAGWKATPEADYAQEDKSHISGTVKVSSPDYEEGLDNAGYSIRKTGMQFSVSLSSSSAGIYNVEDLLKKGDHVGIEWEYSKVRQVAIAEQKAVRYVICHIGGCNVGAATTHNGFEFGFSLPIYSEAGTDPSRTWDPKTSTEASLPYINEFNQMINSVKFE